MMKKISKIIALMLALTVQTACRHDCDCTATFEWMKQTFEENDASFRYIIEKKGQDAYDFHNLRFRPRVDSAKSRNDCARVLNEWLHFFRQGHIGLYVLPDTTATAQLSPQSASDTLAVDVPAFKKYLDGKLTHDFEGIWNIAHDYTVGIKRTDDTTFTGFIIKSKSKAWRANEVKLRIVQPKGGKAKGIYYMGNRSPCAIETVALIGKNLLQMKDLNTLTLHRNYPQLEIGAEDADWLRISGDKPHFEMLNSATGYLHLPSFFPLQKKYIDSVLNTNRSVILQTNNLIIDLRHNSGGSDNSYSSLLPYLYTNPVRRLMVEHYSTALNNQAQLDIAHLPEIAADSAQQRYYLARYEFLQKHLGEMVKTHDTVYVMRQNTVYPNPKRVGIIINSDIASAAESFLIVAKQSFKVKLFGTSTYGAYDFSNLHHVDSPCKRYQLWYATTRSYTVPDFCIDDIGLQPDFYLDRTIPPHKWVDYVSRVLNGK